MAWPQATDYNAAMQNPALCFEDAELRAGQAAGDPVLGLPQPYSGNLADVYQLACPGERTWAVKCFTRDVRDLGLRERYQAISDHLRENPRPFMVPFHYLEEGIRIAGAGYPILKMRWVEGFTLNKFVAQQVERPNVLEKLAAMWVRLAKELRDARIAHGDLQHGNVVLVPNTKGTGGLGLRLIDYDGLWVPSLAQQPSSELGHPSYQHPQRMRERPYGSDTDRFSHLVIYTALRCLAVGGRELWRRHDNDENLLFRGTDFQQPTESKLLRELWLLGGNARHITGQLVLASTGPLSAVPLLDELLDDGKVRPLTRSEEEQVKDVLKIPAASTAPPAAGRPSPTPSKLGNGSPSPLPPLPSPLVGEETLLLPTLAATDAIPLALPAAPDATILLRSDHDTADYGPAQSASAVAWLPSVTERVSSMPVALAGAAAAESTVPAVPMLEPVLVPTPQSTARIVGPMTAVPIPDVPVARSAALPDLAPLPVASSAEASRATKSTPEVGARSAALAKLPPRRTAKAEADTPSAGLLDWLRDNTVLASAIVVGAAALFFLTAGLLLWKARQTKKTSDSSTPTSDRPVAERPARLTVPTEVLLRQDDSPELRIPIDRRDTRGPLTLRLSGLPEGTAPEALTLAADDKSVSVPLQLGPLADGAARTVTLTLLDKERKLDETTLLLRVLRTIGPRIRSAQMGTLRPGQQGQLVIELDLPPTWDNTSVKVRVEGLLNPVVYQFKPGPRRTMVFPLGVAATEPLGSHNIHLILQVQNDNLDEYGLAVTVER